MSEAALKSILARTLRDVLKPWVVFRHENRFGAGMPDVSVTGMRRTSWIECKLDVGKGLRSREVQDRKIMELATVGWAYYVVWVDRPNRCETIIAGPHELDNLAQVPAERRTPGLNHRWVADYVKALHLKNQGL